MKQNPNSAFVDDAHFEAEVRRIAKLIWPSAEHARSPMVEGRERDAIVQTEDVAFVIEATTSRKKDKTSDDAKKLQILSKNCEHKAYKLKGFW